VPFFFLDKVEKCGRVGQATGDNKLRSAFWIPKATNTHSEYIILITFPLQQWLHESASILRCTYIACLVGIFLHCDSVYYRRCSSLCVFVRTMNILFRLDLKWNRRI